MLDRSSRRSPSTITCEWVSPSGLSNTGFMRTSGTARAASAWKYCALPISPPAATRALLLMFCALKGATLKPRRAYQRASAVARKLFPAPLIVPQTITVAALALIRRPSMFNALLSRNAGGKCVLDGGHIGHRVGDRDQFGGATAPRDDDVYVRGTCTERFHDRADLDPTVDQ